MHLNKLNQAHVSWPMVGLGKYHLPTVNPFFLHECSVPLLLLTCAFLSDPDATPSALPFRRWVPLRCLWRMARQSSRFPTLTHSASAAPQRPR